MKHPSSQALFAYWDKQRDGAPAPDRSAIEPDALRSQLGEMFVVSCDLPGYPFRFAGTRLNALLGQDLKGQKLTTLFVLEQRRAVQQVLDIVSGDTIAVVAGITATAPNATPVALELLLLPFAQRAHSPLSMTGLLAPLGGRLIGPLSNLRLNSWRTVGQQPRRLPPRKLHKFQVVRGLTVYEGND
ncbi:MULTISPECIES: PAS domain-containing protein [Rhodopseudomonas]|uniref:PAS domain-containing protein n=1 Tax=Rhodopseudomonas palustris (strain DX-1) TaxID=652103 RepID=E6VNF5_RHOPX|nr:MULTISPECIES: PAS domain-containing protein [Rhodopseudomonas]NEW88689.1 PAS domain-containing protein [Rhodopseudomonas sp. WA056]QDL98073.1 PAS domain-containing protein [Rhodopseudomonas palustris]